MNILEIIAAISTIICVILSAKEHIIAWPIGIISVLSLIGIYLQSGLYFQIILQSVFLFQCIIGWYNWGKKDAVIISSSAKSIVLSEILLAITIGIGFALVSMGINHNTKISIYPYLDGISAMIALLGNWYLTRKIIQAWPLFMAYNVMIAILLFSQGVYLLGVLNIVLFFISFNGYNTWKRDLKGV